MPRRELRWFVEASLDALSVEAPRAYGRLCERLDGRSVRIESDRRPFALDCRTRRVACIEADGREEVVVGVDGDALLDLIDGRQTLEEALRQDRLVVRAAVGDAARLFDALLIYVRGGIRCPTFPALLAQFRSRVSREEYRRC